MLTRVDLSRVSRVSRAARIRLAKVASIVGIGPLRRGRLAGEAKIIEPLFDRPWYLSQNPDVAAANHDPIRHYLDHGSAEGRRPNPVFAPLWYKEHHEDLSTWTFDPLVHFVLYGRFEERQPSPEFNSSIYRSLYPDVVAAKIDPTEHYVRYGRFEGRAIAPPTASWVVPAAEAPWDARAPTGDLQIMVQRWRFYEVGEPTDARTILGMQLVRALRESRLDLEGARNERTVQALVGASPSDVRSHGFVDIVVGHLLEEEGALPQCVSSLNQFAEAVVCATSHGRNGLINSGLAIPSAAVGVGVDHWEHVVSSGKYESRARRFRFLHVISTKGGDQAEQILNAFGNVFDDADDVSLVLVVNSEDDISHVRNSLTRLRDADAYFPDVELIEEQMTDADLKSVYQSCHVFLAANHVYGFNLPVAQAMLCGLPPVIIGHGGHMDYCDSENAWLVDFDFVRVKNSVSSHDAFVPEIDLHALEATLWRAYVSSPAERFRKAWSGRKKLLASFTWKDVALRLARFATREEKTPAPIGWLTTWNVRCGIGIYVEHMLATRSTRDHMIFAARQEPRTREDGENVVRTWVQGKLDNNFSDFYAALASRPCDVVIIQFNYGFFNHFELGGLIENLIQRKIVVIVDLHSTVDQDKPNYQLTDFLPALRKAHRVLIHNASDWPRMKKMGLLGNALFSPLGVLRRPDRIQTLDAERIPVIISFGFCFEGKGLVELVHAMAMLRDRGQRVHLRMLNAEYPTPHPQSAVSAVRNAIERLDLHDCIEFRTEYLDDETCLELIAEADLFVNPYQFTNESASAATRYGMATGVPVAVTPLPIFDDLGDAVFRMSGSAPEDLADSISDVLRNITDDTQLARRVAAAAETWRREHDYALIGARIEGIARALTPNCLPSARSRVSLQLDHGQIGLQAQR